MRGFFLLKSCDDNVTDHMSKPRHTLCQILGLADRLCAMFKKTLQVLLYSYRTLLIRRQAFISPRSCKSGRHLLFTMYIPVELQVISEYELINDAEISL